MTKEQIKREIKWLLQSKCSGGRFKCVFSNINIFDVSNLWSSYRELFDNDVEKWIEGFQGPYLYMKFRGLLPLCPRCLLSDIIDLAMDGSYTQAQLAEVVGNIFPTVSLFPLNPILSILFSVWQGVYASGYRKYYDSLPDEVISKITPWAKDKTNTVLAKENIQISTLKRAIEEAVIEIMYEEDEIF